MVCNTQEVGLSELIVSPGLKAYEYMNKSRECLFSSSPPACKYLMQQEEREIRDGQWKRHRKICEGQLGRSGRCWGKKEHLFWGRISPTESRTWEEMQDRSRGHQEVQHLLMPLHGRRNATAKYSPLGGLGLRNPRKQARSARRGEAPKPGT